MTRMFIVMLLLSSMCLRSQNVCINNDGSSPDASAILDIKSNSKGLLTPRMTTLERTSIPGPALGLTVFDLDTYSYWVYRGDVNGGWREMLVDLDKNWQISGTHMYNLNNGNVGIGINNPQEKLSINAANPNIQFLNSSVAKGFLGLTSNDIRLGTYNNNSNGNLLLSTKGLDRIRINENGLVGIGTSTGTAALTLNGTDPTFQFRNGDVDKGFLKINANDMIIGTNSSNLLGNVHFNTKDITRMSIEPNGDIGIGTTNPSAKLEVSTPNDGQVLRLNAANQTFMGIWENNGYRGYVGSYYGNIADIDIGSIAGAVHLVTGSSIDLTAKAGKIGIGTENPEKLLDINNPDGDAYARIMSEDNDNAGIDFTSPSSGTMWRLSRAGVGGRFYLTSSSNNPLFTNPINQFEWYTNYYSSAQDDNHSLGTIFNRWTTVYATNGTINTSDAREKSNIKDLNYGIKDVMKLRPVSFTWNKKPNWGTKLGLIAQEVKEVIGEVVVHGSVDPVTDEKGDRLSDRDLYGIYYSDLIPVLIKATQEQQIMIDELQKEVKELKKIIQDR